MYKFVDKINNFSNQNRMILSVIQLLSENSNCQFFEKLTNQFTIKFWIWILYILITNNYLYVLFP